MRNLLLVFVLAALCGACGHRSLSPEELQHKIDSVQALETIELLKQQGINLQETNPLKVFYDSLSIQALPLQYSEDYVTMLPNYMEVPEVFASMLEVESRTAPKAIALPDRLGARLMLLAADVADGECELWLYSLDNDCFPLDKLELYEPQRFSETRLRNNEQKPYFSITSDYEINLLEYASDYDIQGQLSTFIVDESRMFVEKKPL